MPCAVTINRNRRHARLEPSNLPGHSPCFLTTVCVDKANRARPPRSMAWTDTHSGDRTGRIPRLRLASGPGWDRTSDRGIMRGPMTRTMQSGEGIRPAQTAFSHRWSSAAVRRFPPRFVVAVTKR